MGYGMENASHKQSNFAGKENKEIWYANVAQMDAKRHGSMLALNLQINTFRTFALDRKKCEVHFLEVLN